MQHAVPCHERIGGSPRKRAREVPGTLLPTNRRFEVPSSLLREFAPLHALFVSLVRGVWILEQVVWWLAIGTSRDLVPALEPASGPSCMTSFPHHGEGVGRATSSCMLLRKAVTCHQPSCGGCGQALCCLSQMRGMILSVFFLRTLCFFAVFIYALFAFCIAGFFRRFAGAAQLSPRQWVMVAPATWHAFSSLRVMCCV